MTTSTKHTAGTPDTPETSDTSERAHAGTRWSTFLKRALQFSFLFFLLKGLAWLAVGFLAWRGLT